MKPYRQDLKNKLSKPRGDLAMTLFEKTKSDALQRRDLKTLWTAIAIAIYAITPTNAQANATCEGLGYMASGTAACQSGEPQLKCPASPGTHVFCKQAPCVGVTIGQYQICAEWCPGATNVTCKTARNATCNEYINSVNAHKRKTYPQA